MNLRTALPSDAAAVATLHAESWRATYRGMFSDDYLDGDIVEERTAIWSQRLQAPADNQLVLLAVDEDDLLGFVCAYGNDDRSWGTLVDNLHVRGDQQGRGLGRLLLGEAAAWSQRLYPAVGLYLWVLEGNTRARRFYESLGARHEDSETTESPGGTVTGLRYVWPDIDSLVALATDR